jgi:hypothetical protein
VEVVRIKTAGEGQRALRSAPGLSAGGVALEAFVNHGRFNQFFLVDEMAMLDDAVLKWLADWCARVIEIFVVFIFAFCYGADAARRLLELLPTEQRNVAVIFPRTLATAIMVQGVWDGASEVTLSSAFIRSFVRLAQNARNLLLRRVGDIIPDMGVEGGPEALALPLGRVYPSRWSGELPPFIDVDSVPLGWTVDVVSRVDSAGRVESCEGLLVGGATARSGAAVQRGRRVRRVVPMVEARGIALSLHWRGALTADDLRWAETLFGELAERRATLSEAAARPWPAIRKAAHRVWPNRQQTWWLMEALVRLAWRMAGEGQDTGSEAAADGSVASVLLAYNRVL